MTTFFVDHGAFIPLLFIAAAALLCWPLKDKDAK